MIAITARRHLLPASIVALSGAAWATLWLNDSSHAAMHGHHHHGAVAGATAPLPAALMFIGSWTMMTVAMMLPTSLPVLRTFQTIAGARKDRALLVGLVASGYLVTWASFGASVHVAELGLRRLALASLWAREHAWTIGGVILLGAGSYQFTPLKYRCLDKCRSPLSFVIEHWQGRHERRQAFRLGVHHGLFCVGCCWALMLLMFVVGTANVVGMLVLGMVMAVEKNVTWGRRLAGPLGVVLIVWGIVTLVAAGVST
jgi:predicted metal-binding membrane protein